jgi:hypothetical protein
MRGQGLGRARNHGMVHVIHRAAMDVEPAAGLDLGSLEISYIIQLPFTRASLQ